MADVHNKETRSRNMAAITSKKTRPEIRIKFLFEQMGMINIAEDQKEYYGHPDLIYVVNGRTVCIFVHGCFWHGHDCYAFRLPTTNTAFWYQKIMANQRRDREVSNFYRGHKNYRFLVIWECTIRGRKKLAHSYLKQVIKQWLDSDKQALEIAPQE